MQTKKDDRDFAAQRAAILLCERKMTQHQIGEVLEISQPMVSRLLRRAEEAGWLERRYRFRDDRLPKDRLEALRMFAEPRGLLPLLGGLASDNGVRVREVYVFESGQGGESRRAVEHRLRTFGRAAAVKLRELIPNSRFLGVTWGSTIRHVVDALEQPRPTPLGHAIGFVPVSGEPMHRDSNRDTSSHLVERLHRLFRPLDPPPPSLTGVAALIARNISPVEAAVVRKFFAQSSAYQEVFGDRAPLIDRVDSLLTSVGKAERPMGFVFDELLQAGSTRNRPLTREALARLVAGDVGGVLIPRRTLGAADRREVDVLNDMWTGLKRAHLERIALDADRRKRPGVIVVSMGADRAEIIGEAVRCGLVNVLVIDRSLATALTKELASRSA
jgi:DNA-binding transcriptional regulator LsrR (DeoR family)